MVKFLYYLFLLSVSTISIVIILITMVLWRYGSSLPDYNQLSSYQAPSVTRFYSYDGKLIEDIHVIGKKIEEVNLKDINPNIIACRHTIEHIKNPKEFISQLFDGFVSAQASGLIEIWANAGFTFAMFAFCYYFLQNDKDNGLLYLIPILALMGWTANSVGIGMRLPQETTNIESVNALTSMAGAVGFSAGGAGFLSNALLGYYILGKPKFNSNIIYNRDRSSIRRQGCFFIDR